MDHMKVLKRAWQIVKQYRTLWWIGLLLVVAGGGLSAGAKGSVPNGSNSGWRQQAPTDSFGDWNWELPEGMPDLSAAWGRIAPAVAAIVGVLVVLACLSVVVGLAFAVLRFVTRVSLIKMVDEYEETGQEFKFKAALKMGWSRSALRLFLLDLMTTLPLALAMILLIAPLGGMAFAAFSAGEPRVALGVIAILAVIPVILIGIVIGIALGPVRELAYRTIVVEELGPWAAFKKTVSLVRRHFGPAALQWLILVGLRIAWGIVLIPVMVVLAFVAFFAGGLPGLLVGGLATLAADWPLGLALGALVFVPIALIVVGLPSLALNTLATVYHSTVWTMTYRELLALDDAGNGDGNGDEDLMGDQRLTGIDEGLTGDDEVEPEYVESELVEFKSDDPDPS